MDSRLASEIEFYVKEGVTNVREMKRLVGIFVKNNLFAGTELPKISNLIGDLIQRKIQSDQKC